MNNNREEEEDVCAGEPHCGPLLHGGPWARFCAINTSLPFARSKEQVGGLKGRAGFQKRVGSVCSVKTEDDVSASKNSPFLCSCRARSPHRHLRSGTTRAHEQRPGAPGPPDPPPLNRKATSQRLPFFLFKQNIFTND